MYKLIRIINQNRKQILIAILAIVFVIITIQILNSVSKENKEERVNELEENMLNNKYNTSNYNPSHSVITGSSISEKKQSESEKIIKRFIDSCNNGNVKEAYELLSIQCKEELYQTIDKFEKTYYTQNFKTRKLYSIQAWNSWPAIYKVEFYEDMLATGKIDTNISLQDFFTIVEENNETKLNISEYITKEEINKKTTNDGITVIANYKNVYKDYEIYNITIENVTDNDILLNSNESTKTMYLQAKNDNKYSAHMYEIKNSEMNVNKYNRITINIKYNKPYLTSDSVNAIVFEDIILNAEEYKNSKNKKEYENRLNIQIDI